MNSTFRSLYCLKQACSAPLHRYSPALRLFFVIALLVAFFQPLPIRAEPLPQRDKSSPFGMVTTVANRVRSDEIDAYIGLLREAGVQWVREEIFWDKLQRVRGGPYLWNGDGSGFYDYDRSVSAQAAAGIRILGLLDYNPAWFKGHNPPLDDWIVDWGDYVYQVVARYGRGTGAIKHWEIWNEPNLTVSGYESGLYEIKDYVRILEVARAAAKAADPEAIIVLGGLAAVWGYPPSPTTYDYFDYLEVLGQLGAWQSFDVLAIHPYRPDPPEGASWRRDHEQTFHEEMRRLDAVMLRYGAKPVWLTEVGWASNRGHLGVSEDAQAQYLVRLYLLAITYPSIEKVFWYDFRNDTLPTAPYDRPVYDDSYHELHFGLLRRTFPLDPNSPSLRKPAFVAYRTLTNMLAGLRLEKIFAQADQSDMPSTYWYRFGGERRIDVLWNPDTAEQSVSLSCGCREVLVRQWNGKVRYIIHPHDGILTLKLDEQGWPLYVEYDPPSARSGRFFPATGHTIHGRFLAYWQANGGLPRFGYPLTEEIIEPELGSGRPRVVQYFERARFEHFPEYTGTLYEVQLGLLGDAILRRSGVDWQLQPKVSEAPPECMFFPETGHSLCPPFLERWKSLGGLPLLGMPITEPFTMSSLEQREQRTVQYFERARFEHFPEHAGTPYEVQLGLLGRELLAR